MRSPLPFLALAAGGLLLAACSANAGGSGSVAASGSGAAAPPAASTPSGPTYTNPVLAVDFPDPGVMRAGQTWYAYATTNGTQHVQLARSTDLVSWEPLPDALPELPTWADGDVWAPEVWQTEAGYVMYYAVGATDVRRPDTRRAQCISLAVADAPEGPFVDDSTAPLVCQGDEGGSIDPYPFQDADGSRYLLWKNDGNCCNRPSRIWIQPLTADGLQLTGSPTDTGETNDAGWEGRTVEAPTLLLHEGTYVLLYSANAFDSPAYAVGYATADAVTGPYTDGDANPILAMPQPAGPDDARGPGGQTLTTGPDGSLWLLYHAWDAGRTERQLWLSPLHFESGRPVVDGPDPGPQAAP